MNRSQKIMELIGPDINVDRFGSRVDIMKVESTFDPANADAVVKEVYDGIQAPFKQVSKSTLGGVERTSIMIKLSLDPKESWNNGILHNSRYCMFAYNIDGVLELFSGGYKMPKFRKVRVKSPADAVAKINAYLKAVEDNHES